MKLTAWCGRRLRRRRRCPCPRRAAVGGLAGMRADCAEGGAAASSSSCAAASAAASRLRRSSLPAGQSREPTPVEGEEVEGVDGARGRVRGAGGAWRRRQGSARRRRRRCGRRRLRQGARGRRPSGARSGRRSGGGGSRRGWRGRRGDSRRRLRAVGAMVGRGAVGGIAPRCAPRHASTEREVKLNKKV